MSYELIFECDYGNRKPLKSLLKKLLDAYNADIMPMVAIFVNNNPYKFEAFVVLDFESEYLQLKEKIITSFAELSYKRITNITLKHLIQEQGHRRFNSTTFLNSELLDIQFDSMFLFHERDEIFDMNYFQSSIKAEQMIFVSYCSKDEKRVDDFVSILNG